MGHAQESANHRDQGSAWDEVGGASRAYRVQRAAKLQTRWRGEPPSSRRPMPREPSPSAVRRQARWPSLRLSRACSPSGASRQTARGQTQSPQEIRGRRQKSGLPVSDAAVGRLGRGHRLRIHDHGNLLHSFPPGAPAEGPRPPLRGRALVLSNPLEALRRRLVRRVQENRLSAKFHSAIALGGGSG